MSPQDTQDELFRRKLSETAVPDWREGWQRLEPRLPGAGPSVGRRRLRRAVILAAAAALALWWGWNLWRPAPAGRIARPEGVITRASQNTAPAISSLPEIPFPPQDSQALIRETVAAADSALATREEPGSDTPNASYRLPQLSGVGYALTAQSRKRPGLVESLPAGDIAPNTLPPPVPLAARPSPPSASSSSASSPPGWHFSLRLNANGSSSFGAGPANANPLFKGTPVDIYPAAYVGKSLSHKVSLQLGLAVASPVDVRKEGLNRSIPNPMRAMATGVSASQDSINFSRLYYADIPLTVQYHLNDRFTVGSGLQVSVLEKAIGRKQQLDYNADGLLQQAVPEQPRFENIAHDQAASGMINPVDLRMVLGLHYRLGEHWKLSVQYQYGLTDISGNRAFLHHHVNRNQVFQTAIGFQLK